MPTSFLPPRLRYSLGYEAAEHVLGVVGYGAGRPADLAADIPFIQTPLAPLAGGTAYEIWQAPGPVRACAAGPVAGAYGGGLAFGAVRLAPGAMEETVEQAYDALFHFLAEAGCPVPLRFWNYLGDILGDEAGMERYRRFNIGRHRAFTRHLRQAVPPAASGVGGVGESVIYVLGGQAPAVAVENPRQMSAYAYPPQYGPRSPGFSRAGRLGGALFISGTASIVGHETRHADNATAQAAETAENLRTLISAAGLEHTLGRGEGWAVKTYMREGGADVLTPVLAQVFGAGAQRLDLRGDVCRSDLALEVEAFYQGG